MLWCYPLKVLRSIFKRGYAKIGRLQPFSKWFGKYHKSVMPLHVDGLPEEATETKRFDASPAKSKVLAEEKGCIQISIKNNDGFLLQKAGLSYVGLKLLVERLEGLC